jgi:hypothetical protein
MVMALQTASASELIALLLRFELAEPLLLALKEKELTGSSLDVRQPVASHQTGHHPAATQPAPGQSRASQAANPRGKDRLRNNLAPLPLDIPASQSSDWQQAPTESSDSPNFPHSEDSLVAAYCKHHQLASEEALQAWCFRHALSPSALLAEALHLHNRQAPPADEIPGSEESLFLRFKDRLDRVLYGLIRVDNEALARDLFFAIEAGELRFGEAARRHSMGPEARTEGIVGPVDLATPHPEISSRLRMASPGELIMPFKLEQWHMILRLDYRFEATLDSDTRQFLRDLSLRSQAREAIESELLALAAWVQGGDLGLGQ